MQFQVKDKIVVLKDNRSFVIVDVYTNKNQLIIKEICGKGLSNGEFVTTISSIIKDIGLGRLQLVSYKKIPKNYIAATSGGNV